jgi:beta-carotene ketolase (CrtW type)
VSQLNLASIHPIEVKRKINNQGTVQGILIATIIFGLWASTIFFLLSVDVSRLEISWIFCAIAFQTFLYTGMFITAHDAMHRSLFPQNQKINDFLGSVATFIYACFSYKKLLKNHWMHHRHPASELDPDFHDGVHKNFVFWYLRFLGKYWSWTQLVCSITLFHGVKHLFHIPEINLILFWIAPSVLSSFQLFYFGSFLPHREPQDGYTNPHRAQSSSFSTFWSFITCYHFGYHQEHHEHPDVPWWQLPVIRKLRTSDS